MKHIFLYVTSPPGNFSPHNSSFKPSWKKRHLQGGFGGCSVPTEGSGWGSILPLLLPPFPCVLPQGPSLFPGKSRAAGKGSFFQRLQPCQVILSPQIQLWNPRAAFSRTEEMSSCILLLLMAWGVLWGGCLETSSIWLFPVFILSFGGGLPSVDTPRWQQGRRMPESPEPAGLNDVTAEGRDFWKHCSILEGFFPIHSQSLPLLWSLSGHFLTHSLRF